MPLESTTRADAQAKLRVLIVDDEAAVRRVLAGYLARGDYAVTTVGTRAAALEALQSDLFDVVVSDVLLPDGDGIDILNFISRERSHVRVITVTGGGRYFAAEFYLRVALALGAVVLEKPFTRDVFLAAVDGRPLPATGDTSPAPSAA